MELTHQDTRPVDRFASEGVRLRRVTQGGDSQVVVAEYGPGSVLGRHPAATWQLFTVVAGSGWVSGTSGQRTEVGVGACALWAPKEEHESGSQTGMVAVIVETATRPG